MEKENREDAKMELLQPAFTEEEQELINTLTLHGGSEGIPAPEVRALLLEWEDEQRGALEKKYGDTSHIWLDWRKGLLYSQAGFNREAFVSLESALLQAWNEKETELLDAINADIATVERKS